MLFTEGAPSFQTFDQWLIDKFNNNFHEGGLAAGEIPWGNLILCAIAVILSVFLCGIVGLEREKRGRSAGLRTHLLVGVGSCLVMIISIYGFPAGLSRDVARLAAQVVTGVGFLGAGAIIHNNGGIKGLTTASTIWLVMAIGLCCGSMNFILALFGTLVVMIVLISFRRIERSITKTSPMFVMLAPSEIPVMTVLLEVAKEYECSVTDMSSQVIKDGDNSRLEVTFKLTREVKGDIKIDEIVKSLEVKAHALSVQVLNHH